MASTCSSRAVGPSLLALPDTILVNVLAELGRDSPSSLISAASTCRTLHSVISVGTAILSVNPHLYTNFVQQDDQQTVWRNVHSRLYDDPRKACAFFVPRTTYDWRSRVMERHVALRFLRGETSISAQDAWKWERVASVVFRAVPDMYYDMPAAGEPSVNADILYEVAGGEALAYLCSLFAGRNEDCNHVEALFCQFHWFSRHYYKGSRCAHRHSWRDGYDTAIPARLGDATPPCPCPSDQTPWHSVVESARESFYFLCTRYIPMGQAEPTVSVLRRLLTDGIKCLRGTGLLGLTLSASNQDEGPWDWAQVTGRWCGGTIQQLPPHFTPRMDDDPGFFQLTCVAGPQAVLEEMRAQGYGEDVVSSAWSFVSPTSTSLNLSPNRWDLFPQFSLLATITGHPILCMASSISQTIIPVKYDGR